MVPKIKKFILKRFQTHYQIPLNDDKLNNEYALDDNGRNVESNDGNRDDYDETENGTKEYFDSQLSCDECSDNLFLANFPFMNCQLVNLHLQSV